jgi:hypothetical protein
VSTGTDFDGRSSAGVPVPGVAGGVKAGDMRDGGGSWWWTRWKSDMARGRGDSVGGKAGDACAGNWPLCSSGCAMAKEYSMRTDGVEASRVRRDAVRLQSKRVAPVLVVE